MKSYKSVIITVMASLMALPALGQTDIESCIRLAYDNYPQIQEYNLIEASRKFDLENAATAWAPQVNISGKASWQSTVVEMPFDIIGMKFNIPHDQYGISADINQQIWDGGATSIKRKLVDAGAEVKSRQLDVNLYSIRSRVQNLYLGINLIDRQLALNDVLRANLERTLQEIESMVENGVAYLSDRDQIKVSILSCNQQKIALQTDRKAYVQMLSLLTGQDLSNAIFQEPNPELFKTSSTGISRPELALYDAQARQVDLQKRQQNANLSPRFNLNLQAGYGRPGLNMLSAKFDPYFVAGLKMQWNIGAFYTIRNDRRKSDAEAERVELARRSFLLNTTVEAQQKQSEIDKAADIMQRDGEIIRLRQNIRMAAESQYKEGVLKMNEYLNLLDDEFTARLNSDIHSIQYIMAVFDLQNTTGNEF